MDELRGIWRGKTTPKRNGEEFDRIWVKGDLIHSGDVYYIHPVANAVKVQGELGRLIVMHEVDPSTLGECTGLRDKNGKPIFEGDILKVERNAVVKYNEIKAAFVVEAYDGEEEYLGNAFDEEIEVIGNIHDNPEMLE